MPIAVLLEHAVGYVVHAGGLQSRSYFSAKDQSQLESTRSIRTL